MGWEPIALFMAVGWGALLALRFPVRGYPAAGTAALAFWLGALVTAVAVTAAAVVTGRIYYEVVWGLLAAAAGVAAWRREDWLPRKGAQLNKDGASEVKGDKAWLITLAAAVMGLCAVVQVIMTSRLATSFPIIGFDAIGNFALKARLWFDTRELYPTLLSDPEYLIFKRRYPPAIPMAEGVWALVTGGWHDEKIKYLFVAFYASAGMLVWSELRRQGARLMAWVGAAVWIVLPFHVNEIFGGAIDGFGDIPLAMTMLAAAAAIGALGGSRQIPHAILMGLLIGGTFWVKKEGLPFAAAALALLAWRRAGWQTLGIAAGVCAAMFALQKLTTLGLPHFFEKDVSLDITPGELARRVGAYWGLVLDQFDSGSQWGKRLWTLILAAWAFKAIYAGADRRRWLLGAEIYFVAFMFAVYSVVFWLTAFVFERTFESTFDRIFIHLYPLLLVATFRGVDAIAAAGGSGGGASAMALKDVNWRKNLPALLFIAVALYAGYGQFKQTKSNKRHFELFQKERRAIDKELGRSELPALIERATPGARLTILDDFASTAGLAVMAPLNHHPLLVVEEGKFAPYAAALRAIEQSDVQTFWLIATDMDPAFSLNYFVWPKQIRMAVPTQEILNRRALGMTGEPIKRPEPEAGFEAVVRVVPMPAKTK